MEKPILSIIVPVYNAEAYVGQCLSALCHQTGLFTYEVVVIDDGSTDSSRDIVDAFEASHPDLIRSFHTGNEGLCAARNHGLDFARGEWVSFVDSDDIPHPDFVLTLMRAALCREDCDVACCGFNVMAKNGRSKASLRKAKSGILYPAVAGLNLLYDTSVRSYVWNKVFRRSLIERKKIRFYPFKSGFEDLPFVFAAFLDSRLVSFVRKSCYTYRSHREGSLTNGGLGGDRLIQHIGSFFACRAIAEEKLGLDPALKMFKRAGRSIYKTLIGDLPSSLANRHLYSDSKLIGAAVRMLKSKKLPVYGAVWERNVLAYTKRLPTFVALPKDSKYAEQ